MQIGREKKPSRNTQVFVILRSAFCDEGPMRCARAIPTANRLHRSFGLQRTSSSG